jgi:hypothetical protein
MSYVERNLLPNEEITYRARLHRIIYFLPDCIFLVAILVGLGGGGWIAAGLVATIGVLIGEFGVCDHQQARVDQGGAGPPALSRTAAAEGGGHRRRSKRARPNPRLWNDHRIRGGRHQGVIPHDLQPAGIPAASAGESFRHFMRS